MQTATMPTNVTGIDALAGGVSGVPATAMPGGLQSAGMASIELGKKRMRDSNDDLLMVPRLMHGVHYSFFVAGLRQSGPDLATNSKISFRDLERDDRDNTRRKYHARFLCSDLTGCTSVGPSGN